MLVRLLSALVLAPPVLAAFYLGTPYLEAVVVLAAAILAWEWAGLCGPGRLDAAGAVMIVFTLATVALVAGRTPPFVPLAVGLAGCLAMLMAAGRGRRGLWYLGGACYVAVCCASLLWLHEARPDGSALAMFWLLLTVWATDSFAFLVGRAVGGPKLAPRISPRKTWAGLLGGVAAAMGVGAGVAIVAGPPLWWPQLAGLSGILALVAQCGDLAISVVKRQFGAKDSGALIPGHGGLFDRVDGLMAAALALACLDRLGEAPI